MKVMLRLHQFKELLESDIVVNLDAVPQGPLPAAKLRMKDKSAVLIASGLPSMAYDTAYLLFWCSDRL